jgi:hypothetical protein
MPIPAVLSAIAAIVFVGVRVIVAVVAIPIPAVVGSALTPRWIGRIVVLAISPL